MLGRSIIKTITYLDGWWRYRENMKDPHMVLVDLENLLQDSSRGYIVALDNSKEKWWVSKEPLKKKLEKEKRKKREGCERVKKYII